MPLTAPLISSFRNLGSAATSSLRNHPFPSPSVPDPSEILRNTQFPSGVAVGSDDFRPSLVTVKGGPAFQLVKPHIKRLQEISAKEELAARESLDEIGGFGLGREMAVRKMSSTSQSSTCTMGLLSDDGRMKENKEEEQSERARAGPRRMRTTSDLKTWKGFKHEIDECDFLRDERNGSEGNRAKESKWLTMMGLVGPSEARGSRKVQKLVLKGGAIPASLRGRVWGWLLNVEEHRVAGVWEKLACKERGMERVFEEIEIGLGSCMTAVEQVSWCGDRPEAVKSELRKVLRAFAHFGLNLERGRRITGYRPEIGRLAGLLLSQTPAEDVFWILVGIVTRLLPGLWADEGDECIGRLCEVFDGMLNEMDPVVSRHLANYQLSAKAYLVGEFFDLYANSMSQPSWLRMMDLIVLEGFRGMIKVGLSKVEVNRNSILESSSREELWEILMMATPCRSKSGFNSGVIADGDEVEELSRSVRKAVGVGEMKNNNMMKKRTDEVEEEMVKWCEASKIKQSSWIGKLAA